MSLGKQSVLTSIKDEWKYCGNRYPFSLKTKYYELEVKMKTLSYPTTDEDRGFIIGWVTYNDGEWLFFVLSNVFQMFCF